MNEALSQVYGPYGSPVSKVFGPVINPRTYLRALHLVAMFPLGLLLRRTRRHAIRERLADLDHRRPRRAHRDAVPLALGWRRRSLVNPARRADRAPASAHGDRPGLVVALAAMGPADRPQHVDGNRLAVCAVPPRHCLFRGPGHLELRRWSVRRCAPIHDLDRFAHPFRRCHPRH